MAFPPPSLDKLQSRSPGDAAETWSIGVFSGKKRCMGLVHSWHYSQWMAAPGGSVGLLDRDDKLGVVRRLDGERLDGVGTPGGQRQRHDQPRPPKRHKWLKT